ncbi:hypothetical protein ACIBF1_45740 [Spirillospora sp. NPDC050679]
MGYMWGLSKALLRALREQKRQDGNGATAPPGRGRDTCPDSPDHPAMPRGEESGIK